MGRRIGPPKRITAHRQFTVLQRDPTGKAKRKYARNQQDPADQAAIDIILDVFCTVNNGVKAAQSTVTKTVAGKKFTYKVDRALRHNKRTKANGLAAWCIAKYEQWRRMGMSAFAALEVLTPDYVGQAIDSGEIGQWCERRSKRRIIETDGTAERLRNDGPRAAGLRAQRKKWREIGDKFREEMSQSTPKPGPSGLTEGEIQAKLNKILDS